MGKAGMKAAMKAAMKTGMKAMKAAPMRSMKAMKKVKKVSIIARGKRAKAASARGKKNWAQSALKKWIDAVKQARKQLGVTGFCAVNGKTAQGKALYAKAKAILGK